MNHLGTILTVSLTLYGLGICLFLISENRRPQATLAWLLVLIFAPGIGLLLYILFGRDWKAFSKQSRLLRQDLEASARPFVAPQLSRQDAAIARLEGESASHRKLMRLVRRNSHSALTTYNRVEILQNAAEFYPRLMEDMEAARHSIHLQYFIWRTDAFTARLKAILTAEARAGVEVRLLYDPLGSHANLSRAYIREMHAPGVRMVPTSPLYRLHTISYRNHRKITVIDGTIGYTGGMNIGQEHLDGGEGFDSWRDTVPDFQSPAMHGERRYAVRGGLFQNMAIEAMTFRNTPDQEALPMRSLGSFLPGTDVGGAGVHWNGQTFRFLPSDFVQRSHYLEKYGPKAIPEELTVQDWGVTYEELEPFCDRFEYLCGTCGKAGNLQGKIQPGGNPFEGPRAREYPNPPTDPAYAGALFANAAVQLGYTPFQVPSANMTKPYTNFEGLSMQAFTVCGFCERFGCEHFAKASPQTTFLPKALSYPNVELRTRAHVTRVLLDNEGKRATAVLYVDGEGQEAEQPAEIVIFCAFALNDVKLLLNSGIGQPYDPETGQGTVGRNYTYQTVADVNVFYPESVRIHPFMGAGALGTAIDDYNGDNFDHAGLGFVGGGYIAAWTTVARPIEYHPVPPGTPRWGLAWKQAVRRHYHHTLAYWSAQAIREQYLKHPGPLVR